MSGQPHFETTVRRKRRHLERLAWLPVIAALLGMWTLTGLLTLSERQFTLERVQSQLSLAAMTLADFNELAEENTGEAGLRAAEHRTAAIWRVLLLYPSASVWVEADGVISGGQEPADTQVDAIVVEETRERFIVRAALPKADALADWEKSALWRAAILLLASVAFILLTGFLIRALQQRSRAEQDLLAQRERAAALNQYKTELEETVETRTEEVRKTNLALKNELTERKAAQARLKEHDALLNVVTKSAAELLGTHSIEDATTTVLEMIGKTLGVSRVHINRISTSGDGHMRSSVAYEWCAAEMIPVAHKAPLQELDLTTELPHVIALLLGGRITPFTIDELKPELQAFFDKAAMRSCLQIPIMVDETLWGAFSFIDSGTDRREWNWAETDTLQTLAGLFGEARARANYIKELADANMIVQNSPTILYRLRGEPPFSLIYISHNIRKFGHEPSDLVGVADWTDVLMDPEDEAKMGAAMARTLDKDTDGASIEFRLRTAEGTYRWVENRYTPVRDKQGRLLEIEGIVIDITERKAAEEKIAQLARTDALTGLANRGTFIETLRQTFAASRRGGNPFAIMYLDLDHFKPINDTLGHQTGDVLLREVAERLKGCARTTDLVARLGGDEFAVLQTDMLEPASAGTLAGSIRDSLAQPFMIDGNTLHISCSIGICPYTADSEGPDEMLAQADLALYRSKEEGRNCYRFHSDELDNQVLERMTLADELRAAIAGNELEVYYQPQVAMASGRIVGMEALVRWNHPQRGLLPAATFIPVAEKTGAVVALGQWLLDQACKQLRAWRDADVETGTLTINLSLAQLKTGRDLLNDVKATLHKWQLQPADLSFDVTEATLAQLTLIHSDVLVQLRELGTSIAIADFGSEYSSLNYLRTYHVNQLKIGQSFVDASIDDQDRAATMRAITQLAQELHISVIAQGIETAGQLQLSRDSATIGQGVYFSDAMDAEEVTKLLRTGQIKPDRQARRKAQNADLLLTRK